eukprot:1152836-Pelagomonas_calceolata.AAC.5
MALTAPQLLLPAPKKGECSSRWSAVGDALTHEQPADVDHVDLLSVAGLASQRTALTTRRRAVATSALEQTSQANIPPSAGSPGLASFSGSTGCVSFKGAFNDQAVVKHRSSAAHVPSRPVKPRHQVNMRPRCLKRAYLQQSLVSSKNELRANALVNLLELPAPQINKKHHSSSVSPARWDFLEVVVSLDVLGRRLNQFLALDAHFMQNESTGLASPGNERYISEKCYNEPERAKTAKHSILVISAHPTVRCGNCIGTEGCRTSHFIFLLMNAGVSPQSSVLCNKMAS